MVEEDPHARGAFSEGSGFRVQRGSARYAGALPRPADEVRPGTRPAAGFYGSPAPIDLHLQ